MALAHLERRREHPREGKINCHCYHHDDCPCHLYSCWVKRPQLHKYKILTKVKWTSSSVYTLITHSTGTETEAQLKITKPFWQKKRRLSTPCERMYIPGLEHNQKTGRLRFHPLSPQEGTLHQPVQVTEGMKVLFPIVLLPAKQLVWLLLPKEVKHGQCPERRSKMGDLVFWCREHLGVGRKAQELLGAPIGPT